LKAIKVFIIIISLIPADSLFAQSPPVKQWDARFGGGDFDILRSVKQTADGGYIMGGHSGSTVSGDKTQFSQGGGDYWLVKTNSNGVKQWDFRFGGNAEDILHALQQTSDGGYILGGYSLSGATGDKSQATRGLSDFWIVKISPAGVKQWDARFGGSGEDVLYSVHQTSDGGYILGGSSASGASGDKSEASRGLMDYWIVKVSSSGVKQWDKRFGGSADDALYSVSQTTDGGYILGGYSGSGANGDKTQASQGGNDFWIVKVNETGVKLWDARYGGTGTEFIQSLQQTNDGGYILGGYSSSPVSGDKSEASRGGFDYWAVKITDNGTKQWDVRFGGSLQDVLYSLEQTKDGGYLLGGYSGSGATGDKSQPSQGDFDFWIVKTNNNGSKLWDRRYGGSGQDVLYGLQQTNDGGYILGGYSSSGITGDKSQPSWGGHDYWMVKIKNFVTITGPSALCNGDTITLTANEADSYLWSNGDTTQSTSITEGGNYYATLNQLHTSEPYTVLETFCSVTINLKAFINGYYHTSGDSMSAVIDPVNYPHLTDSVTLSLADAETQQIISGNTQPISTSGSGIFSFTGLEAGHRYYFILNHRNSLEVWSKNSFLFETPVVNFDFTQ
jgi:hypothetical protein